MISVCMASYNGARYIREQLESILRELPDDAEVIVSDDGSTDETLNIVRSLRDSRIRIADGPRQGVVRNFESAIGLAAGDVIFLADQDDIWNSGKVEKVLQCFRDPNCLCVLHDAEVVDAKGETLMPSFFQWRRIRHGVGRNLLKNSYTGCCMAFRAELKKDILPFPQNIEMHDWWIGLIAERKKASVFLEEQLIRYRRHGENTNSLEGYSLKRKIQNRLVFLKALI